ncbi:ATP-binding protein [Halorubellus sp. PRR65]|uniref:ATP-binding protein n=1 Tax=Halorubellus sp. PRR65 TaxID=3098148 RepID=UPI002B259554|nr:ATP-binding protein [Halorubellus sp. PRR65]
MTDLAADAVDRRLDDPGRAYDALTGLDSWFEDKRVRRLRRVLYPAYRVEYGYGRADGGGSERADGDGQRTAVAVLDGREGDSERELARYRETVRDTEPLDASRLDLGTSGRAGTAMPLDYEVSDEDAERAFRERADEWTRRASADDETSERVADAIAERLGFPDDLAPDGFEGVVDVSRVYLPFWCVEYTAKGEDETWLLGVRVDDRRVTRHPWVAHRVVDEHGDAYRRVDPLGHGESGDTGGDDSLADVVEGAGDGDAAGEGAASSGAGARGDDGSGSSGDGVRTPDGVSDAAAAAFEAAPDRGFDDVGGMHDLKAELEEGVLAPLTTPERYEQYGLGAVNGVLLHGPPGCGKTYLARALAGELGRAFGAVTPADLSSKWVGEAADNVADVFAVAKANDPCVLFVDELDAVAGDRDRQMTNTEQQMVNQLLVELEAAADQDVVVVAATNHVQDVDDAILRSGRFDKHVEVGPPDADARREILDVHLRGRPTVDDLDLGSVVRRSAGFAASDLELAVEEAARAALDDDAPIGTAHLLAAVDDLDSSIGGWLGEYDVGTPPSRAGDLSVPGSVALDATEVVETDVARDFATVSGMTATTRELDDRVVHPVASADVYDRHGIPGLDGALLFGPPGCGKTYLARAVAGELDVPFLSVTPAALVTDWPGSPAEDVADAFALAKANAPSVLFLDDLDTLAAADRGRGSAAERRLHDQLTMELRTIVDHDVLVLGATHLLSDVDDAVLHAAAFDERVEVPPPDVETRAAALEAAVDDALAAPTLDFERVAADATGYAIADLKLAAGNASRAALREDARVTAPRLRAALEATPSTLANWPDRERYSESEHGSTLRYIA